MKQNWWEILEVENGFIVFVGNKDQSYLRKQYVARDVPELMALVGELTRNGQTS